MRSKRSHAGGPLVAHFRVRARLLSRPAGAYLSDSISIKWLKGRPERSEHPPSTGIRQQWGISLVDSHTKNRDIGSLPHSPISVLPMQTVALHDLFLVANPPASWQWVGSTCIPPVVNLRSMLSHHRVLAYRSRHPADLARLPSIGGVLFLVPPLPTSETFAGTVKTGLSLPARRTRR